MCFGSCGSITSGGAGEPFNPGTAPQTPPQMFIRVGGGGFWLDGLVLGGWVPQNPKTPQPLINVPCQVHPHAHSESMLGLLGFGGGIGAQRYEKECTTYKSVQRCVGSV